MTETEWLASNNPIPMLQWLAPHSRTENRYCYRTALLFGLACFERVIVYRGNAENWVLRRAEELADGVPDAEPHITASHVDELQRHPSTRGVLMLLEPEDRLSPVVIANETARRAAVGRAAQSSDLFEEGFELEQAAQAALLREVVGNPFRLVEFDPAWRTSDVMLLAQGIYDEKAFDRIPILADALQDAGCDSDDVLNHCRSGGVHVRGCWVCDLVLGKE